MNFALCFFPVMPCVKPSIPSNSRIIYPRTDQVRYTHGTTLYLACHEGHLLTGSPIMECNYTTWLKREFKCIGMFFFQLKKSIIMWPVSPPSRNPVGNYDKTDVWFTRAGPDKVFWPHSCAVLLHFPRKWLIKMNVNSRQRFPWIVNCSDPKKKRDLFGGLPLCSSSYLSKSRDALAEQIQMHSNFSRIQNSKKKFSNFGGSRIKVTSFYHHHWLPHTSIKNPSRSYEKLAFTHSRCATEYEAP